MTIAFWCVLIAALLPYVAFSFVANKLNPKQPRISARNLEGLPARAHAAQLNHFEAFPLFAAAVIIAHVLEGASTTVNMLAIAYIVVRIGFTAAYLADRQPIRSACFVVGLILAIAIFINPLFH